MFKKPYVPEGKRNKLFADHVSNVCKALDHLILPFVQQVQGLVRPNTDVFRDTVGRNVYA